MLDGYAVAEEMRELWRPPEDIDLVQWSNKHAKISENGEVKDWSTFPFQEGWMRAMTDPMVKWVTVKKSSRVGYTKGVNNLLGFHAHHDPCQLMMAHPTIADAEGHSKEELAPMIRDVEVLTPLFPKSGRRDSSETILHKTFPGGLWGLVGADSPRGFRRVGRRVVVLEEIDGYAPSAGDEGDQVRLAVNRTTAYWNAKIVMGSTPTILKSSRIHFYFLKGTQEYRYLPCPFCNHMQILEFKNLKWEKKKPETARFKCTGCGDLIAHTYLSWMDERGEWRAHNKNPEIFPDGRTHRSFHIWTAYSPLPNATWAIIAHDWIAEHKILEKRKTLTNTMLGEVWEGDGDAPPWKPLYDRRLSYKIGTVPAGGLILFCGVDVQKGYLALEIVAFGRNMRTWSVEYRIIEGDTSTLTGEKSAWPKLELVLNEEFIHESGAKLKIKMMGVDTGFNTQTVYSWVKKQARDRVIATDGRDSYSMTIGQPSKVEIRRSGKKAGAGLLLWPIGVSLCKQELYGWLKQEKPTRESGQDYPHGWCEFPEYPEEFFKGLTAEEVVVRIVKGYSRYGWEKKYERNEPLDCRVIARACAALAGCDTWDAADVWAEHEAAMVEAPTMDTMLDYRPEPVMRSNDDWMG